MYGSLLPTEVFLLLWDGCFFPVSSSGLLLYVFWLKFYLQTQSFSKAFRGYNFNMWVVKGRKNFLMVSMVMRFLRWYVCNETKLTENIQSMHVPGSQVGISDWREGNFQERLSRLQGTEHVADNCNLEVPSQEWLCQNDCQRPASRLLGDHRC